MFINSITLQGNVGKDAETRLTPKQLTVTNFTLATSHGDITEWHRIVAFGELAEEMRSIQKGQFLHVTGELRSRSYTGQDGMKRTVWNIYAKTFEVKQRPARRGAEPVTDPEPPAQDGAEEVPY